MKQQFIIDTAESFQTYIYADNQKVVPTSANITVYEPGSDTELVGQTAMSVASDGLLSFDLSAGNNDTADENYKVVIDYVVGADTFYVTMFYDIVNSKIHIVITDTDVVNELPQLRENGWRTNGQAQSGSSTTLVDAELIGERNADDYFTGGTLYSIDRDETRFVTDFSSATGTVTTEAFTGAIATDKYVLTKSYTTEIKRAFEKIEDLLNRSGRRPHLIIDSGDLRELHITYAVAEVTKGMASDVDDNWWALWEKYDKRAFAIFNDLNLKYDEDWSGNITSDEEDKRFTPRRLERG